MEEFITQLFIHVFQMSIAASYLILAVVVARLLLRKVPKGYMGVLWLFVAVKLLCPFTVESVFSLLPSESIVEQEILYSSEPEINTSIPKANETVNQNLAQNFSTESQNSINKWQLLVIIISYL